MMNTGFWKQSQHFSQWYTYTQNQSFNTVFGVGAAPNFLAIGRVQLGVFVPQSLAFTTPTYTFDFDNVRIIPGASGAGLMALGMLGASRRRR